MKKVNTEQFFVRTHRKETFSTATEIWVDRETGVNYIVHTSGGVGGITPRLKADGTPVVTPLHQLPEEG